MKPQGWQEWWKIISEFRFLTHCVCWKSIAENIQNAKKIKKYAELHCGVRALNYFPPVPFSGFCGRAVTPPLALLVVVVEFD